MGNGESEKEYPEDSPEDTWTGGGEIDRIPVSQLPDRYGIVRSAFYKRLDDLGIRPDRVGNRSYINANQLKLLDEFHQFIQAGGTAAEFLDMRGMRRGEPSSPEQSGGLSTIPPDFANAAALLSEMMARMQPPAPPPDPLAYLEALEKAYRNQWLLRTSEIATLLGLPADEIKLYGDSFTEAGFLFTKAGYRAGGELAWRVSKPIK